VVVAITAMLVCMCYMVNARRAQKQRDDVSWDMQMRGVEMELEREMEEGNSGIDGRRIVKE
tara:strand:+ start:448 stop:630 length:183 start_codon:yes stop_codon:yes gene_type:complete